MTYPSGYRVLAVGARRCAKEINRFVDLVDPSYETSRAKLQQYCQRYNDVAGEYEALHKCHDVDDKKEHPEEKKIEGMKEKIITFQHFIMEGQGKSIRLPIEALKQIQTYNVIGNLTILARSKNDGRSGAALDR